MKLNKINLYKPTSQWTTWNTLSNNEIANDMLRFMRASNGIGLAANQVGMAKRLFVMEVDGVIRFCFNPAILEASEETVTMEEGCLSFPSDRVQISRPSTITVTYQNTAGQYCTEELTGLAARCFQHEFDHLNGITMLKRKDLKDPVSPQ